MVAVQAAAQPSPVLPVQVTVLGSRVYLVPDFIFWRMDADLADAGQTITAWFILAVASCVSGARQPVLLRFEAQKLW